MGTIKHDQGSAVTHPLIGRMVLPAGVSILAMGWVRRSDSRIVVPD